jgi:RNA polymerase sigma-70 factor, ECF subfamily
MNEERNEAIGDADELLVLRFQRGDRSAFEQLFRTYERRVYNVVLRVIGNPDEAEDLKQEAFFRAFKSIGSFRGGCRFSTWLFRIATNLCLDEIKRKKPQASTDELFEERNWRFLERDAVPDPADELERDECLRSVRTALEGVPPHYRVLLVLRYVEELPYEEIARVMGCSVNALNVRLHRARQVLRKLMEASREAPEHADNEVS